MLCSRVRELLPGYSVEMLDGRTHREVETHLAQCDGCRRELRAMAAAMALVEQYGVRQPPVGLFNGVRNRIESGDLVQDRAPWWAWLYTRPARAGAMAMATAAVVMGLVLPAGGPRLPAPNAMHPLPGGNGVVAASELAGSIRQHAMSAGQGPLADRVAWEAMAQLVTQDKKERRGVE